MHEHFWEEGFVQFFFSPNYIVIFFGKKKKNTRASLLALDSEGSISFPVKASNPEKEFESEVSENCSKKKNSSKLLMARHKGPDVLEQFSW